MEPIVPNMVKDLTDGVQFRSILQGEPGEESLDCRLWFRNDSGQWIASTDGVQVYCNRLMQLQRQYAFAVQEAITRGEARVKAVQESFREEMSQAQVISDKSTQEFHLVAELVNQAGTNLINEYNERSM